MSANNVNKRHGEESKTFPFVLGALRSPPDVRDFQYAQRSARAEIRSTDNKVKLPSTLDLRKKLPPIINQGMKGTCVACVGACIKEYQERMDCGYDGYFSPDYIYYYRENKPVYGMWPRDMMKILQKRGCCSNYKLPYDEKKEPSVVSNSCDREAANYKIGAYYQIKTVDELKEALYKNGPCYIAFDVYNDGNEMWKKKKSTEVVQGSHAMTVVGYKKDRFIIRNSWGKNWGSNGYTYYKFKDFGAHIEIWTCVDERGSKKVEYNTQKPEKENKDSSFKAKMRKFLCCC